MILRKGAIAAHEGEKVLIPVNMRDGSILFRLTLSYLDSFIGNEAFFYQLLVSFKTIDQYNDKFFMLSKGAISIEDFLASED